MVFDEEYNGTPIIHHHDNYNYNNYEEWLWDHPTTAKPFTVAAPAKPWTVTSPTVTTPPKTHVPETVEDCTESKVVDGEEIIVRKKITVRRDPSAADTNRWRANSYHSRSLAVPSTMTQQTVDSYKALSIS